MFLLVIWTSFIPFYVHFLVRREKLHSKDRALVGRYRGQIWIMLHWAFDSWEPLAD